MWDLFIFDLIAGLALLWGVIGFGIGLRFRDGYGVLIGVACFGVVYGIMTAGLL